jgi:hypothetical protein
MTGEVESGTIIQGLTLNRLVLGRRMDPFTRADAREVAFS